MKIELFQIQVSKVTGSKVFKLYKLLENPLIFSLSLTRLRLKEKLTVFYENKKYKPLDLCLKKTGAIHYWLNKQQKIKEQQQHEQHTPEPKHHNVNKAQI